MKQLQLILSPEQAASEAEIRKAVAKQLQLPSDIITSFRIIKRSVDARQRQIHVLLTVHTFMSDEENLPRYQTPRYSDVSFAKRKVVIVGGGPAGLFAALQLLETGIKPIIVERGKEVSARKRDIAILNRNEGLNSESNYCFGEGGAGTFSDGKLFSRSNKRGNMQRVMELFHYFGADESVLYEAHAHIGSDRLPAIIRRMRETIIGHGGEVRFLTQMRSVILQNGGAKGIETMQGERIEADAVILAVGHSAHDTYRALAEQGIRLETKGFAMGVRVEHPQALINRLMYHFGQKSQTEIRKSQELVRLLGNASYSLVTQVAGRGVYSFCMCPGGHIVPAGSAPDLCVVNGMSASHRNSPYANSGMVVEIRPDDIAQMAENNFEVSNDGLDGLRLQEYLEQLAFRNGAVPNVAPAQCLQDFVEGRESLRLPSCSYLPGIVSSRLDKWLPEFIGKRLQQGFRDFDKRYHGILTNEAVILGVESRSSSPVRIPRDRETMQHTEICNLYPCGEGAGYAGGITSSALDGICAAEKISGMIADCSQLSL